MQRACSRPPAPHTASGCGGPAQQRTAGDTARSCTEGRQCVGADGWAAIAAGPGDTAGETVPSSVAGGVEDGAAQARGVGECEAGLGGVGGEDDGVKQRAGGQGRARGAAEESGEVAGGCEAGGVAAGGEGLPTARY